MSGQRDRAAELRGKPDLWNDIHWHLLDAAADAVQAAQWFALDLDDYLGPTLEARLRDKFRAGELEHGRDWLNMSRDDLRREIYAELLDLVLYHAMVRARWVDERPAPTAPPFLTHTDPGDEQDAR